VELARAVYLPPASAKRNSNPEPLVAADVETHA